MKLYTRSASPYSVRVLASLALKGISVELVGEPKEGTRSAEFLAINPLGKMPVLVLENDGAIAESLVILEFLEDRFPERSLRPREAFRLAQMRLAGRVIEQQVDGALLAVVMLVVSKSTDKNAIRDADAVLNEALTIFTQFWQPGPYAFGSEPTILDCLMLPVLTILQICSDARGHDFIEKFPEIVAYQKVLAHHPQLSVLAVELAQAMAAEMHKH
ncbi:glutathione S-transferase family protein [Pseudomonas hefeiensis]|uniref:Glutathione S-transferase family protein n=1 Tax=Pseudomonas hefeiensis TaxID=2738125 RepID=A0ABY9GGP4_9PSED|nr:MULTISPECIES: glutathione S-transferase family protein [unclassified Pseudomonas]WLH14810.1 glutathione S-transferase family protein [Pseudomonas sp. FP205]WLH97861.1 glutathione S-transferase family protein [Pseudomonas sp. FP53]WLI42136.1 glutathione S-transferase family protein [Pseudomonas sp. FP821]